MMTSTVTFVKENQLANAVLPLEGILYQGKRTLQKPQE
jgi:hypothetical protein